MPVTTTTSPVAPATTSTTLPGPEICRTVGFWGKHAGTLDDKDSLNVAQGVLDAAGGVIRVCGRDLHGTACGQNDSVLQALCSDPPDDLKPQTRLATQLVAAALNCIASNGSADCSGISIGDLFRTCDAVCQNGTSDQMKDCTDWLECWNNGGFYDVAADFCASGRCSDNDEPCDNDDMDLCAAKKKADCVADADNCHDRPLVNRPLGIAFDPPGAAGSKDTCEKAKDTKCTIFSSTCSASKCP
jgi:hypothetical protein